MQAQCSFDECDHLTYKSYNTCACHLPQNVIQEVPKEELMEMVKFAALENDQFEVSGDGDIRLKEE